MEWFKEFSEYLFPEDSRNLRIEDAFALKHKHIPSRLFKYRSADEYSIKNLRDGTVWLAHPSSFNDPYDCHIFVNLDKAGSTSMPPDFREMFPKPIYEQLEARVAAGERPLKAAREVLSKAMSPEQLIAFDELLAECDRALGKDLETLKNSYRACSFSARLDSMLMWSHYADQHKGFCIEYTVSDLPPSDYCNRFMYPVIYQDEVFDASTVMKSGEHYNNIRPTQIALVKAADWKYEEEWRLVLDHGFIKEHGAPFRMPTPKAVYLGSLIKEQDATEIKEICAEKGIPVFHMEHDRHRFRMTPRSI